MNNIFVRRCDKDEKQHQVAGGHPSASKGLSNGMKNILVIKDATKMKNYKVLPSTMLQLLYYLGSCNAAFGYLPGDPKGYLKRVSSIYWLTKR